LLLAGMSAWLVSGCQQKGATVATYTSSAPKETIELKSNGTYFQTLTLLFMPSAHGLSSGTLVNRGTWKLVGVPANYQPGSPLPPTAQVELKRSLVSGDLRETSTHQSYADRTLPASAFQIAAPPEAK
jgi:hypothetical protein